ncbi:MAG: TfuA-like protein [Propylenella sp.]
MKVLFAGPSLHGTGWAAAHADGPGALQSRGPAGQGDIARAALEGATAIGLIDGRYEDVAAVWHKEILFALKQGVQVFGAASMGALRAAECAAFGMIGLGKVFERYRSGELVDDAAVAQLHAPPELDHAPLTEALVNVEATIQHFFQLGAIGEEEAERLDRSARALFFKERTYPRILAHAGLGEGQRGEELKQLVKTSRVDVKREDALLLLAHMRQLEPARRPPPEWRVEPTATWRLTLKRAHEFIAAAAPAEEDKERIAKRA